MPVFALFEKLFFNDILRRYTGVVGAGHPLGLVALLPFESYNDILDGVIQGMAHVEDAGDIWRGYDYRIRLFVRAYLCVEIPFLLPKIVYPVFGLFRIVSCRDLFHFLESFKSLYSILSTRANQLASMMFCDTPTVHQELSLSCD